jgi:hypothetical protein
LGFTAPLAVLFGGDLLAGARDTTATIISSDTVGRRSVIVAETVDGETVDMTGGRLRGQMPPGSTVQVWISEFSGRALAAVTPNGEQWDANHLTTPWVLACAALAVLAAGVLLLFHRFHRDRMWGVVVFLGSSTAVTQTWMFFHRT